MNTSILVIHGIRTDGKDDIYRLADHIEKHTDLIIKKVDLPHFNLFNTLSRRRLKRAVAAIEKEYTPGCNIIAHSNGCRLIWRAMKKRNLKFGRVFFFSAALNKNTKFPDGGAEIIYNIHNAYDTALLLAKLLPFHPFGGMGRGGYVGKTKFVQNISEPVAYEWFNHTSWFNKDHADEWNKFVLDHLQSDDNMCCHESHRHH